MKRAKRNRGGGVLVLVLAVVVVTATGPAGGIRLVTDPSNEAPAVSLPPPTTGYDRSPVLAIKTVTDPNETRRLVFAQGTATVVLNCTHFWLEMTPATLNYYLVPIYLDTATDERYRFIAGPLNGRVADPFGETAFLLLEVEIRVPGEPSVAVHLPRQCLDPSTVTPPS